MKSTYKVFAIISIVIGAFALLGSMESEDFAEFVGGVLFLGQGLIGLQLLKELK